MPVFPPLLIPDAPPPISEGRWHGLDLLRGVAMMMGVYLHGALAYMFARPTWAVHDASRSTFFDLTVAAIHGFRMQLFFVLAGFFARLVAERRGVGGLLRQRAARIGLPFFVGMLTLIPITLAVWFWACRVTGESLPPKPSGGFDLPTTHLWFLEYLLVFYAGVGLFSALGKIPGLGGLTSAWDFLLTRLIRSRWKVLILPFCTMPFLLGGPAVGEVERVGESFWPGLRGLGYFGFYFLLGWLLHRRRECLDGVRRFRGWHAALALVGFGVFLVCADLYYRRGVTGMKLVVVGGAGMEIYAWSMTFLLMGLSLTTLSGYRAWARYLADASYWFYLAHLPLVIALQAVAWRWSAHAVVKAAFVVGVSSLVLWVSYHWCVRRTFVGKILNGRRAT